MTEGKHIEIGPSGDPGARSVEKGYQWKDFSRKTAWIKEGDARWGWIFNTEDQNEAKMGFWNLQKGAPKLAAEVRKLAQVDVFRLSADKLHEKLEDVEARLLDAVDENDELVGVSFLEGGDGKNGLRDRINELKQVSEKHDREVAEKNPRVENEDVQTNELLKRILEEQKKNTQAQTEAANSTAASAEKIAKVLESAGEVPQSDRGERLQEKMEQAFGEDIPGETEDMGQRAESRKRTQEKIDEAMMQFAARAGGDEGGYSSAGFGDFKPGTESGESTDEQGWRWFNEYVDKLEDQGGKFDYTLMYPIYRFLGNLAKKDYPEYKKYNFLLNSRRALHEVAGAYGSEAAVDRYVSVAYYAEMSVFDTVLGLTKEKNGGRAVVADAFRQLEKLSREANEELDDPEFVVKLNREFVLRRSESGDSLRGDETDDRKQRSAEDLVSVVSPAYEKGDKLSELLETIDSQVEFRGAGRMAFALFTITGRKDLLNRRASIKYNDKTNQWYREKEDDIEGKPNRYKLDGSNEPGNFARKIFWRRDWLRNTGGGIGIPATWKYLEFKSVDFFTAKAADLGLVNPSKLMSPLGATIKDVPGIDGGLGNNQKGIIYSLENAQIEQIKFASSGEHNYAAAVKDWGDSDKTATAFLQSGFLLSPDPERLFKILDGGAFNYLGYKTKLEIVKRLVAGVIEIHQDRELCKKYQLYYFDKAKEVVEAVEMMHNFLPFDDARTIINDHINPLREIYGGSPIILPTKNEFTAAVIRNSGNWGKAFVKGVGKSIFGILSGGK